MGLNQSLYSEEIAITPRSNFGGLAVEGQILSLKYISMGKNNFYLGKNYQFLSTLYKIDDR